MMHTCQNCGDQYVVEDGYDPTPWCHPCAQEGLAEAEGLLKMWVDRKETRLEMETLTAEFIERFRVYDMGDGG